VSEAEVRDPEPHPGACVSFAVKALADCLSERTHPFPVHSYVEGDQFSGDQYAPGTVVVYRSEQLHYSGEIPLKCLMKAAEKITTDQPLPPRPLDNRFQCGKIQNRSMTVLDPYNLTYKTNIFFGVVASKRKSQVVVTVPSEAISLKGSIVGDDPSHQDFVVIDGIARGEHTDIPVGRTMIIHRDQSSSVTLKRINALDVCASNPSNSGKRMPKIFGNFAFRLAALPS